MTPRRWRRRAGRLFTHTRLSFWAYRYRYLVTFTAIGFLSILLELRIAGGLPDAWGWGLKAAVAFVFGLALSFVLNVTVNFRVPRPHVARTFRRFAAVSLLSFGLNMAAVALFREHLSQAYAAARLVSAALLYLIAYTLHRRFTFDLARDFGVAVYAARSERVMRAFARLGRNCDHVHVDLIDETMSPAAEVDLDKLAAARRLWRGAPVCLHVMSETPSRWLPATWGLADWFLFHVNVRDDLAGLIAECRLRGKRVGVMWHASAPFADMLPHLPHVDFAAVLGIARPGVSGQKLLPEALEVTAALDRMRPRYGYEVMFDGGVNAATVRDIRAKYVVAASAVLKSATPIRAAHALRTGARYERRAA